MKSKFLLNILLSTVWAFVNGSLDVSTFVVGFILGYLVLVLMQPLLGGDRYGYRFFYWIYLFLWFCRELLMSSLRVAKEVIFMNEDRIEPGVIAIPLDFDTEAEVTFTANFITLTPGTLSIDISPDLKTLYIHDMYITDGNVEEQIRQMKEVEHRIKVALGSAEPDYLVRRRRNASSR